jgi:hypothetical protein
MICISCIFGSGLGIDQVLGRHLQVLVTLDCLPNLFLFTVLFFIDESPKHLLLKVNDETAADKSIRFYYGAHADVQAVRRAIRRHISILTYRLKARLRMKYMRIVTRSKRSCRMDRLFQ